MPTPDEWFNQALRDYQAGIFPAGKILDLGRSPYFAFQGWLSKIPILMVQQILRKAVDKHIIDLAGFENLPTRLKSPVAIFESRTVANSFVIVTDLVLEKKPVVVAIHPTQSRQSGTYWQVKSIHARDPVQLRYWQQQGLLRFLDKKKSQGWLQDSAPCN